MRLTVILLPCVLLVATDARPRDNGDNGVAYGSASESTYSVTGASAIGGAFGGTSDSRVHDGHKGIRSYTDTHFPRDNNADHRLKVHNAPSEPSRDRGIKGVGRDHNKNSDGCPKCKWENDDYWERDEPEEEQSEENEDECDDGDDGQYRPNKKYDRNSHAGTGGSSQHSLGIHKTGPVGVYNDEGGVKTSRLPSDLFGSANYPADVKNAPSGYGTTQNPASAWHTPFKPNVGAANAFGTSPSSSWNTDRTPRPIWNRRHDGHTGTTPRINLNTTPSVPTAGLLSQTGPIWNTNRNDRTGYFGNTPVPVAGWNSGFPDLQKPESPWNAEHDGGPIGNFDTTVKSGINLVTDPDIPPRLPSSQKPETSWNPNNTPRNFETTPKPSWNTEPNVPSRFPSSQKPGISWNPDNTPRNFETTPKSSWNTEPNVPSRLPSSQKPETSYLNPSNAPTRNFETTPKPNWNIEVTPISNSPSSRNFTRAPWSPGHGLPDSSSRTRPRFRQGWVRTGVKPGLNRNPNHGAAPTDAGCTRLDFGCTQGKIPIRIGAIPENSGFTKNTESPISSEASHGPYGQTASSGSDAQSATGITSFFGNAPQGATPDIGKKDHPFGLHKPTSTVIPSSGSGQDIGSHTYENTPRYNKPEDTSTRTWPSDVSSPFGINKKPHEGYDGSTGAISTDQGSTFNPVNSPEISVHPDVTKPTYGDVFSSAYPWPIADHINTRPSSKAANPNGRHLVSSTGFGTIKPPFGHANKPGSPFDNAYDSASKYPDFTATGAIARADANAFATSVGTHGLSGVTDTMPFFTTLRPTEKSVYSGVKGSPEGTRPFHGAFNSGNEPWPRTNNPWFGKQPGDGSGIQPRPHPDQPNVRPNYDNEAWPHFKPETGSVTRPGNFPGIGTGLWPDLKPGSGDVTAPGSYPDAETGARPHFKPPSGSATTLGDRPGLGTWPAGQSGDTWPNQQPGHGGTWPGSGVWPVGNNPASNVKPCGKSDCGPSTKPSDGSGCGVGSCGSAGSSANCGDENYNLPGSCPGAIKNPNGVDKTYYPAGIGDGNVPNTGNTHGPDFPSNAGAGPYYPGSNQAGAADQTPGNHPNWNSANPFLYGTGGNAPSSASRPWDSGTTAKPIGKGNPFLDPNWNTPRPEYTANDDKNVIPPGGDDTKPIGQGNPFLDGSKGRGDIYVNPDERVIPLGGNKPAGNPFATGGTSDFDDKDSRSSYPEVSPHSEPSDERSPRLGASSGGYGSVKDTSYSEAFPPQAGFNPMERHPQGLSPLQCKLGLFGCGTSSSGSYMDTKRGKHPAGAFERFSGDIGIVSGSPGSVDSSPGVPGTGAGPVPGYYRGFDTSGGDQKTTSGNLDGSFGNAQASSVSFAGAKSLSHSDTAGFDSHSGQVTGGSWSPSGFRNQAVPNSWASSGASAFASSSSGSWSGIQPVNMKG